MTLDDYEPSAGADGWSNYKYTIHNLGTFAVDLAELVIQSWYSADPAPGGTDDCAAAGARLGPESLAGGSSIALDFGAHLEPNPQFWPQCVERTSGFVIVEVHSRQSTKYAASNWWAAYAVTR